MHTTVDTEDDVLAAAEELARTQNVAVGLVISRLMREALLGSQNLREVANAERKTIGGFRPFAVRGCCGDKRKVNELRN